MGLNIPKYECLNSPLQLFNCRGCLPNLPNQREDVHCMQWVKSLYSPHIGRSLCSIRCTVLTDRNTAACAPLCESMCLHSHEPRERALAHGFIKSNALTSQNAPLLWTHNKENSLTNTHTDTHTPSQVLPSVSASRRASSFDGHYKIEASNNHKSLRQTGLTSITVK